MNSPLHCLYSNELRELKAIFPNRANESDSICKYDLTDLRNPIPNPKLIDRISEIFSPYLNEISLKTTPMTLGSVIDEIFQEVSPYLKDTTKRTFICELNHGTFFLKRDDYERAPQEILHEYFIGQMLRFFDEKNQFPIYMTPFAVFGCTGDCRVEGDSFTDQNFLLSRYVAGPSFAEMLYNFTRRQGPHFNNLYHAFTHLKFLVSKVRELYQSFGFTHGGLHLYNAICVPFGKTVIYEGYFLDYLPVIIDFEKSSIIVGDDLYTPEGIADADNLALNKNLFIHQKDLLAIYWSFAAYALKNVDVFKNFLKPGLSINLTPSTPYRLAIESIDPKAEVEIFKILDSQYGNYTVKFKPSPFYPSKAPLRIIPDVSSCALLPKIQAESVFEKYRAERKADILTYYLQRALNNLDSGKLSLKDAQLLVENFEILHVPPKRLGKIRETLASFIQTTTSLLEKFK